MANQLTIIEDSEYIEFRLPDWLTSEQREKIRRDVNARVAELIAELNR